MKFIKRVSIILCLMLAFTATVPSYNMLGDNVVQAATKSIKLNFSKKSIQEGKTFVLKLKNAKSGKVTWSSSNRKVATVDQNGKVKGVKKGNCTIVAKLGKNSYKCKVTVLEKDSSTSKKFDQLYNYIMENGSYIQSNGCYSLDINVSSTAAGAIKANPSNKTLEFSYVMYTEGLYSIVSMVLERNKKDVDISFYIIGQATGETTIARSALENPEEGIALEYDFTGMFEAEDLDTIAGLQLGAGLAVWDLGLLTNQTDVTLKDLGFTNYE